MTTAPKKIGFGKCRLMSGQFELLSPTGQGDTKERQEGIILVRPRTYDESAEDTKLPGTMNNETSGLC